MGLLSGNSCNIITLLPLGLECDSINASTPQSTNGLIALYITGGTSPYNVSWDNGSHGTLLTNLKPGTYTATVTDYYGDFSASTTCEVGFNSFYLEILEDCKNPNNFVYYLSDLLHPLSGGSVYQITTQAGCWISSGQTLYTGQTYVATYPTISAGPFSGCSECLPTPIPEPIYPNNLCLTYQKGPSLISNINFSSGNTINGYPSWSSSTPPFLIYYNSGTTKWQISGWTSQGAPYYGNPENANPSTPPLGSWVINGVYGYSINITSGICQTPPMVLEIIKTNPTCSNVNNGALNIIVNGGQSPYTYSLDGFNWQSSNVFIGLSPGSYTVYVKDFNSTVVTQSVTLVAQQTFQNYTVSLNLTPGTNITVGTTTTKTSTWSINVSPYPLPPGTTINLSLVFNVNTTAYTLTSPNIVYTNTINPAQSGNFTILNTNTTPPVGSTTNSSICEKGKVNVSAYTTTYNLQLMDSGSINGTIIQYINTPCVPDTNCNLYAKIKDTVSLQNITITPRTCVSVNPSSQTQQVLLEKTGLICPREN